MVFQKKNVDIGDEEESSVVEKKKVDGDGKLVEVPTQTTIAYQIGDDVYDEKSLLLMIYNDLQKIKKGIL